MSVAGAGAVYDRGYRPYDGPRGLRGAARYALYKASIRRALGIRRSWRQKFAPFVDNWMQAKTFFPAQPTDRIGNMTRNNPKFRSPWNWNENFSLAKTFHFTEALRLDLRFEGFNVLNRVR